MSDDLRVIYRAQTSQQAHLLKNLLLERGIRAVVTNDVLEGGAGVDMVGWPTLARVSVAEQDAELARQMALEFEETVSANPELADEIDASGDEVEAMDWPRCPGCDAARPTRCPVCETSGTDFPSADRQFVVVEAKPGAEATSSCGSGGCSSHDAGHEQAHDEEEAPADAEGEGEEPPQMVVCTTCDEPFVPEYPNRCAWCGHEFGDGYAVPDESELMEPIPARAIVVIALLMALGVGLVVYFTMIV